MDADANANANADAGGRTIALRERCSGELKMGRLRKKPWILSCPLGAQLRLRSAWASAKTLIRLGGCPGWSESSLGACHFVGFVMLRLKCHFHWCSGALFHLNQITILSLFANLACTLFVSNKYKTHLLDPVIKEWFYVIALQKGLFIPAPHLMILSTSAIHCSGGTSPLLHTSKHASLRPWFSQQSVEIWKPLL